MSERSIMNVKALLGERFSRLLDFIEEGDVILAKRRQVLSKDTFERIRMRVEEMGGRYVDDVGFEIPKAITAIPEVTAAPVEQSTPLPQRFEPKVAPIAQPREAGDVLTINIRLEDLETGVFSPRKTFSTHYINELAEDIEREGQLKPIIVRPHSEKPDVYQVIDGEHRVRVLKKLGRETVRAEVRLLSYEDSLFLAMRVNEMRGKRLTEIEEASHIKRMIHEFGYTQEEVADKFKRTQTWVSKRLRLVEDLSEDVKDAFMTRVISQTHAREMAELPKEIQPEVVKKVVDEGLSSRETEVLVHAIKKKPQKKGDILSKPAIQLTPPPRDVQEFEDQHGPEQRKFDQGECPDCGRQYTINWVLCRINWREKDEC